MMNFPLTTTSILHYAEAEFAPVTIVSQLEDQVLEYTYAEFAGRVRQLANYLQSIGVEPGDRVATLAWNTHRHLELYYAISCMGAVCHTINPRYSPAQIEYIVRHAQDKALFFDSSFAPIATRLHGKDVGIEEYICLSAEHIAPGWENMAFDDYEQCILVQPNHYDWPELEENSGAALCYTSGTTGNPKGVLYTHRSTCLHSLVGSLRDMLNIGCQDSILPIVPMFHVNAWGLPYTALLNGATLVLPGANMQGPALFDLMDKYKVTFTAGVPTILTALLSHMHSVGRKPQALERTLVGGSAASASLVEQFESDFGVSLLHGWGMTETSPLATLCTVKPFLRDTLDVAQTLALKTKQGRRPYGIELKLVDSDNKTLEQDGRAFGDLLVRGAWVTDQYYRADQSATDEYGWFDSGDIATIDKNGYMQIVDRNKDVIKSGGEWISSVELENTILSFPGVVQAAVIGLPHPKWNERPLMLVVTERQDIEKQALKDFLASKIPSWWMPDEIVFVDALPIGATGKIQKRDLREKYTSFDALPR